MAGAARRYAASSLAPGSFAIAAARTKPDDPHPPRGRIRQRGRPAQPKPQTCRPRSTSTSSAPRSRPLTPTHELDATYSQLGTGAHPGCCCWPQEHGPVGLADEHFHEGPARRPSGGDFCSRLWAMVKWQLVALGLPPHPVRTARSGLHGASVSQVVALMCASPRPARVRSAPGSSVASPRRGARGLAARRGRGWRGR